MHQIRFRLRLRPRPRWGAYSAPPDPLVGFKGAASRQGWGRERDGEMEGRGMRKDGKRGGKGEKGTGWRREGGKVKEEMGGTGRDMWWDGGREMERRKGRKREDRARAPKLQFLAPPLIKSILLTALVTLPVAFWPAILQLTSSYHLRLKGSPILETSVAFRSWSPSSAVSPQVTEQGSHKPGGRLT